MPQRFTSFADFYPFYLREHARPATRRLHFTGTSLVIGCVLAALITRNAWWLIAAPLCGYGFAWIGHAAFEHNHPATFTHPLYSLAGDFAMYRDMLLGRIPW